MQWNVSNNVQRKIMVRFRSYASLHKRAKSALELIFPIDGHICRKTETFREICK